MTTFHKNAAAYRAANPEIVAWISSNQTFDFAISLDQSINKYGALTERQAAAALRCADKAKARIAAVVEAPVLDGSAIHKAFDAARDAKLKRISLRIGDLKFSPAPSHGANAGAIYIKSADSQYLGKIVTDGRYIASYGVSSEIKEKIAAVVADPEAEAVLHGRKYGNCACCGRELSNKESIERGIGPICAEKFGW